MVRRWRWAGVDLNRRRFLGGAVNFAVIPAVGAKDEEAYRFRTVNAEIEMTIEFHDGYASQGFWFGEQMSNRSFCLSGVVIDGSHVLAQDRLRRRMGPRPHAVVGNRKRTAESGDAVVPFLTGAR